MNKLQDEIENVVLKWVMWYVAIVSVVIVTSTVIIILNYLGKVCN